MQITKDTLIWVGITALVATTAAALLSSGIINDAQNDGSFNIVSSELKRGSTGNAVLEVDVRNSGADKVTVTGGTLGYVPGDATSVSVGSGKGTCLSAAKADDSNVEMTFGNPSGNTVGKVSLDRAGVTTLICVIPESHTMKYGESYTLTISGEIGTSSDKRIVSDTSVVYVTTGF